MRLPDGRVRGPFPYVGRLPVGHAPLVVDGRAWTVVRLEAPRRPGVDCVLALAEQAPLVA